MIRPKVGCCLVVLSIVVSLQAGGPRQRKAKFTPYEQPASFWLARDLYFQGKFIEAAKLFRQAFEISKRTGYPNPLCLNYEALCHQYQDDYESARRLFEKAYRLQHYSAGLLDSLNNLGWLAYLDGDLQGSLSYFARALEHRPVPGGPSARDIRAVRVNLGVVHEALGMHSSAYRTFLDVAKYIHNDGDGMNETRLFQHLAKLEKSWGDTAKAYEYCERSLLAARKAYRRPYNRAYYVDALVDAAILYRDSGQLKSARAKLEEALPISENLRTRRLQARVLMAQGDLYSYSGDANAAIELHTRALRLIEGLSLRSAQARILAEIGHDYLTLSDFQKSLQIFQRARTLAGQGTDSDLVIRLLFGLATTYEKLGDLAQALTQYKSLIGAIESLDVRAIPEASRINYWSAKHDGYEKTVALLVRLNHPEAAFEYSERSRSKTLRDMISERRVEKGTAVQIREYSHISKISSLQARLLRVEDPAEERKLLTMLEQARSALGQQEFVTRFTSDRSGRRSHQPTVRSIQSRLLPGKGLFVEFMLSEPRSYAWFISADKVVVQPISGRTELEQRVRAFRKAIAQPPMGAGAVDAYFRSANDLYNAIFPPAARDLLRADQLTIAPDGILYYVPFEALLHRIPKNHQELVDSSLALKEIRYVSSGSLWGRRGQFEASKRSDALVVANSSSPTAQTGMESRGFRPLAHVDEEARSVARSLSPFRVKTLLGGNAKESALSSEPLKAYRVIHFAGHATVNEGDPKRSGLLLKDGDGQDGYLWADEISRLRLDADLVTLSGCETGLGRTVSGEGLISLSRAFHVAGARSVVYSLWKTDDEVTKGFMQAFYSELIRLKSPSKALRASRLALLRSDIPAYRFPYFWAAFVVSG